MKHFAKEELESKLTYFKEAFFFKTGKQLSIEQLETYVKEELKKSEHKLISEAFSNMTHESLTQLLNIINEFNMQKMNNKRTYHKKSE